MKFFAFFKGYFKSQIVYRLATLLNLVGSIILFFVQFSLWKILVMSGIRQDIQLKDMIIYVMLTQLVGSLTRGNFADELGVSIRDGSVMMHLLRPYSYRLYLLSNMLGKNCYATLTSAIPVMVIGCILIGIHIPPSIWHIVIFTILFIFGILIMFELIYVVGLLAFWTQATWFLPWYVNAGVTFLGGTVIPLWFYPPTLEAVSRFLPFRYISFEAINYYIGKLPLSMALRSVGIACIWWVLLFSIGRLLWRYAQRKITINGG